MALLDPAKMGAVLAQLPDADIAAIDAAVDVMENAVAFEIAVGKRLARDGLDWPKDAEVKPVEIAVAILRGASEAIARAKARAPGSGIL